VAGDVERALREELLLLSRVNRRNLVQLLGFCGKRIPVFEFILSMARSTTTRQQPRRLTRRAPLSGGARISTLGIPAST
jgi:hypothetical protein